MKKACFYIIFFKTYIMHTPGMKNGLLPPGYRNTITYIHNLLYVKPFYRVANLKHGKLIN